MHTYWIEARKACKHIHAIEKVIVGEDRWKPNSRYVHFSHQAVRYNSIFSLHNTLLFRFVELPLGQELPDLNGLASLFAEASGNKHVDPYESMQYTDMNLYTLVPDTYTSGTYFNIKPNLSYTFSRTMSGLLQHNH